MFNGGAIINTSKKHPTVNTSSTNSETDGLYYCCIDVKRMRNLMQELGMEVMEPTLVYEDNQPCIKIAEGTKTAGAASTKAMNIKFSKVQEMIQDDQEIHLKWLLPSPETRPVSTACIYGTSQHGGVVFGIQKHNERNHFMCK
jgi:hypothetical protein